MSPTTPAPTNPVPDGGPSELASLAASRFSSYLADFASHPSISAVSRLAASLPA